MENLILMQLTVSDIQGLLRQELESFFAKFPINQVEKESEDIGGIELAIEITGLAKATIYGLVAQSKIPYMKQGKKLYFSRQELIGWITQGRRKTLVEGRQSND